MTSHIDIFLHKKTTFRFLWIDICQLINEVPNLNIVSLPYEVEKKSISLRDRYLIFVSTLSNEVVNGLPLVDCFKIREDFSYWWMTEFQEKQHYGKKSPVYAVLKLMILNDFLSQEKGNIEKIVVRNIDDYFISDIVKDWAVSNGILFNVDSKWDKKIFIFTYFNLFLNILISFYLLLLTYLKNFAYKNLNIDKAYNISFWGYLLNFDGSISEKSGFKSQYWNNLVKNLEDRNIQVNWMHLWLKSSSPSSSNLKNSLKNVKGYMTQYSGSFHYIINAKLPFSLILKTFIDFLKLLKFRKIIKKMSFVEKKGGLDYRYAYRDMFYKDISSPQGLWNILYFNLFDTMLASLPKQKVGFYLQENNSWEFAFLYAWKKHNHGDIIGVPHATIRFWDLRYFSYDHLFFSNFKKPSPDKIAVNSNYAKQSLIPYSPRKNHIIELEALRYSYLEKTKYIHCKENYKTKLILLIAGDYDTKSSNELIKILSSINKKTLDKFDILFKSHPASENKLPFNFKWNNFKIVNEQLEKLLAKCDVICTTNSTTASVEGFCYGIEVLIHHNYDTLNMSPLKGITEVNFFSDRHSLEKQLNLIIEKYLASNSKVLSSINYFFVDQKLSKWDKLIENYLIHS
jgi:surface carbohydrate biosynthesis protein (TIGR04326 family)